MMRVIMASNKFPHSVFERPKYKIMSQRVRSSLHGEGDL